MVLEKIVSHDHDASDDDSNDAEITARRFKSIRQEVTDQPDELVHPTRSGLERYPF